MTFVSPVTHTESVETASTIDNMIKKAKSLGLKYISVTDSGYLAGVLKTYQTADKKGIKCIPGIEAYFYDKDCNLTAGKKSFKSKYFQIAIHALDQDSYHLLCQINSSDKNMVKIRDTEYPAMTWADLEFLSKNGRFTITTTSYNCMVFKPFLLGEEDVSDKILKRLRLLFKENLYLSLFTSPCNMKWGDVVRLRLAGGKELICKPTDRVFTNGFHNAKASDIAKNINKHNFLNGLIRNGVKFDLRQEHKKILSAKLESAYFPLGFDLHEKINKRVIQKSEELGIKILLNDNAFFADKDDKIIQDMKLSEYKRFGNAYWMNSFKEAKEYLESIGINIELFVENNEKWAEQWKDFKFEYKPKIPCFTKTPLEDTIRIIKEKGRMKWDDPTWCKDLKDELELFTNNGVVNLLPYFLNLVDITDYYYKNNLLVGAGRGSAAGSRLAYLMGITHVNPIKYNLSAARFLTMGRVKSGKLPDIDTDFFSRSKLVGDDTNSGYLYEKYGDKVAQVSTRTMLRLKSSIVDVNRFKFGEVQEEIEKISKNLPATPQGVSDYDFVFGYELDGSHIDGIILTNKDLKEYVEKRPDEWEMVEKALGLSRQYARHACAFIISEDSINENTPTFKVSETKRVTQYEAKQCEWAGLIKYDFLVVSCLQDIQDCMKRINKKYGKDIEIANWNFIHEGKPVFIWDLPHSDGVFKDIQQGKTETIFQLGTTSMTPFCIKLQPNCIEDLSTISALIRPGPLDYIDPETDRNMAEEYIERGFGRSIGKIEILNTIMHETYGVIVYQEQLTRAVVEIAGFTLEEAEEVREACGKKLLKKLDGIKPKFIEGALKKISPEEAEQVWSMMVTFGRYAFNLSHSISYAFTSYACAFLKHHYPLEWWASVISNATTKEINEKYFKYVKELIAPPDINTSTEVIEVDYINNKIRAKLSMITGIGEKASENIITMRPFLDLKDIIKKKPCNNTVLCKLAIIGAMDSFFTEEKTVEEKLNKLAITFAEVEWEDKEFKGKKPEPILNEKYMFLTPKAEFLIKKEIYPNALIDLYDVLVKEPITKMNKMGKFPIIHNDGKDYRVFDSEFFKAVDSSVLKDAPNGKDITYVVPGYVISCEAFNYAKNTKKAFKCTIDFSGTIVERVMWPEYEQNEVIIPDIKKGSIAYFGLNKRIYKEDSSIKFIVVENG